MKYRFEAVSLSGRVFRAFTGVALLTAMMSQAVEARGYGSGDGLGGDENSVTRQEVDLEEESEYESLGVVIGGLLLAAAGVGIYEQRKKQKRAKALMPKRRSVRGPGANLAINTTPQEQADLERRIAEDDWELKMRLKATRGRSYPPNNSRGNRSGSGNIGSEIVDTPHGYVIGYRDGVQHTTREALLAASKVAEEMGDYGDRVGSDVIDGEATYID